MNKDEYLEALAKLIIRMPKEDREDILSDYDEHFQIGVEKGRTEEEISKAMGDPKTVAKQLNVEQKIKKAKDKPSAGNMIEALLAAAGLGIFNLIFVLAPVLIVIAIILGLFVAGLAIGFAGIITTISPLLYLLFPNADLGLHVAESFWEGMITIAGGIGLTIAGIVIVVFMAYVAKMFYELMIRYLKLNLKIIKGRTKS